VVLYIRDADDQTVVDPLTGAVATAKMSLNQRLVINRDFLTAFAREIIKQQKASTVVTTDADGD